MKVGSILMALILLASSEIIAQTGKENFDDLKSQIDSVVVNSNFNGVVLLTKRNSVIYGKAKGYSDLKTKTSMKLDDQFVIGSISKQMTAVLVLREYERGKIGLRDKINQYLSEINQPWSKEVSIHQLLTHTHGITDLDKPLEFKQGTQFHYSQLGYELLARILEMVTGKTFEEQSTELFDRYGLTNTFHPDDKEYEQLVKGYEENENGLLDFTPKSLDNYVAAGGFISNAHDLNKWNQLLHGGELVKMETLQLMETKYATRIHPVFDTIEYGYGLLFKDGEQHIQIGALGYVPGFVSACYFYPQTGMNLIVLENTAHDLDDFKKTFAVHTEIMELIKKRTPDNE